jgi:orotate phosphoribosyltransferase-like protein
MSRKRKRKRMRITPEIIEKMVGLRKRGFTYKKISKELGVALQTVAKHIQTKKMGGRKKKVTEEVLEEMRNLLETGLSKRRIADKLDLSYETVLRYLGEEGFFKKIKRKMGLR